MVISLFMLVLFVGILFFFRLIWFEFKMATVTTNDSSVLVTSTQAPVAPIAPAVKRRQVIGSFKKKLKARVSPGI